MSKKDGQCNHRIWKGFYSHRCTRKDWKDGYCKQHHADSVKKRRDDVYARLQAKLAEDSALQDKKRRQSEENAQLRWENERLREALTVAAKAEREACARLCDNVEERAQAEFGAYPEKQAYLDGREFAARECAAAIRARGET